MNRSTVLVIESYARVGETVADKMDSTKYDIIAVDDAEPALDYVRQNGLPSIALIEIQLPSQSGFEIASRLKGRADLPMIFLIRGRADEDLLEGLKEYADDFVFKPVDINELHVRVQMVLARVPIIDYDNEPVIHVDDKLSVDFAHNRIEVDGKVVGLTPTESMLLHVLLRHAPRVVQNRTLLARVWSTEEVYEDTLRVHMHRLRRKLEVDSHFPHYIRTERGVGYRFTQRPPGIRAEDSM